MMRTAASSRQPASRERERMGHRTLPISPAVRTQLPAIPSLCQEHSSSSCRPKRAVQYTNNIQYPTGRGRNRPSAQGTERSVTSCRPTTFKVIQLALKCPIECFQDNCYTYGHHGEGCFRGGKAALTGVSVSIAVVLKTLNWTF